MVFFQHWYLRAVPQTFLSAWITSLDIPLLLRWNLKLRKLSGSLKFIRKLKFSVKKSSFYAILVFIAHLAAIIRQFGAQARLKDFRSLMKIQLFWWFEQLKFCKIYWFLPKIVQSSSFFNSHMFLLPVPLACITIRSHEMSEGMLAKFTQFFLAGCGPKKLDRWNFFKILAFLIHYVHAT